MRLRTTAPAVTFREELPGWLGPNGTPFIEINARPGGMINSAFMAGSEQVMSAHGVSFIRGDDGKITQSEFADTESARAFNRDWLAMLYETCVIDWRTNLVDDETGPIECNLKSFLTLAVMPIAGLSGIFLRFQMEIMEAGNKVAADTQATIKN